MRNSRRPGGKLTDPAGEAEAVAANLKSQESVRHIIELSLSHVTLPA